MIILQGNKIERSFSGDVLFDNINIQVDERDRIALVGRNGAGKSTLLKILVGEEAPTSGEINTKRDLNLSYLAQDSRFESSNTIYAEMLNVFSDLRADEKRLRDMEMKMAELTGIELDKLMTDYDRLSEDFRQRGGFTYESDIRAILNGFKFDESMWEMPISDLSGGQNTRLALAKMLLEKPELLVLDEPTNDLDIVTLNVLEDYLRNFKGCLIVISHDRYFMDKVVDHLLVFKGNGELKDFPGNYTDYREWKETQEQKAKSEQAEKAKQNNKKTTAEKRNTSDNTRRRLSFKEKKELEQLEMEIAALEEEKKTIETNLCSGTLSIEELTLQSKRLPEINENLDEKTLRWLELSEIEG